MQSENEKSVYDRQNDREAIMYLKASYFCARRSAIMTYFIVFMSVTICIVGIVNKYLDFFTSIIPVFDPSKNSAEITTTINLIAGLIVILNIWLGCIANRKQKESVNILERYDAYVFGLPLNQLIMRPISGAMIELYAQRVRKKNFLFFNYYFDDPEDAASRTACFDNQNKIFDNEYRLMVSVQPVFLTMWLGFIIVVFAFALSFNDEFIATLTNVLFPSLSIISLIVSSAYRFSEQLKALHNSSAVMANLNNPSDKNRMLHITNTNTLRSVQDGIFLQRLKSITIPNLLVKRFEKRRAQESWGTGKFTRDFISITNIKSRNCKSLRGKAKLDDDLLKTVAVAVPEIAKPHANPNARRPSERFEIEKQNAIAHARAIDRVEAKTDRRAEKEMNKATKAVVKGQRIARKPISKKDDELIKEIDKRRH